MNADDPIATAILVRCAWRSSRDAVVARGARVASSSARRRRAARAAARSCTFLGLVRATHQGRRVRYLEYEAFEPLALKAFEQIERGNRRATGRTRVLAIHHRIGRLEIGEASVAIVAGAAASRRGVPGVPLRDRARQADRAGLEARVLRGRRRVGRRRDRPIPTTTTARQRGAGRGHARDGAAVRAAARARGPRRLGRATCRPARSSRDVWRRSPTRHPALAPFDAGVSCAVNADFARMTHPVARRRRGRVSAAGLRRLTRSRIVTSDDAASCSKN